MRIMDFAPFAFTAATIGFIYIRRAKIREAKFHPREVSHTASRDIFVDMDIGTVKNVLKTKLAGEGIKVHSEDDTRTVFDSLKVSAFHWGFLYIVDYEERQGGTLLTVGIFGKGPNPPRKKTQEGFLNDFINNKIMPL